MSEETRRLVAEFFVGRLTKETLKYQLTHYLMKEYEEDNRLFQEDLQLMNEILVRENTPA